MLVHVSWTAQTCFYHLRRLQLSVGSLVATSRHSSCQPSSCRDWNTAMPSSQAFRLQRWRRSRECGMLQLVWSWISGHVIMCWQLWGSCIDSQSHNESITSWACWSTSHHVVKRQSTLATCWSRLLTTRHWLRCARQRRPPHQPSFGDRAFSVAAPKAWNSHIHKPQDCYLFNGRFQTSLEDLVFQKGLRLTFRLLLLQLFYQCFYYYHYHLCYHYRCHHCYHHYLMLCAIGLYIYCRRRNRNDCFTITITITSYLLLLLLLLTYVGYQVWRVRLHLHWPVCVELSTRGFTCYLWSWTVQKTT